MAGCVCMACVWCPLALDETASRADLSVLENRFLHRLFFLKPFGLVMRAWEIQDM